MKVKLQSYSDFCARKMLPHPTIPNTRDWNLACTTLEEMSKVPSLFNSEELESLTKTIRYLKRHMTGETK